MWPVVFGAFGLGFLIGAPFCWRAWMRKHRAAKAKEVTLEPELVQFKSLLTDLTGVRSSLQTTAQLLAQRAAESSHEKDTQRE